MERLIIGNSLDKESLQHLEVGLSLSKSLGLDPHVIHADKLADFDTLDNVFANLNLEIHESYISSIIEANTAALEKQIGKFVNNPSDIRFESRSGSASDTIVREAREEDVVLIALGYNQDKSLVEKFLGGITESILHRSDKSVLIVKNHRALEPKKIMIAYDFSHHCNEALEWTKRFASTFNSEVHIVNVVPCYYEGYHLAHTYSNGLNVAMEEIIDENVNKVRDNLNKLSTNTEEFSKSKVSVLIDKEGGISDKINNYAQENEIDLLIVGSHKKGLVEEIFLGSVTAKILKKVPVSILVAK